MDWFKAVLVAGATLIAPLHAAAQPSGVALVGGTIYVDPTTTPIRDGVVVIQDGKIAAVGSRASTQVPPGTPIND
jgi:imidazolonepropionase-like amidohydrolase